MDAPGQRPKQTPQPTALNLFLPSWWDQHRGDPRHPHGRRFTTRYRAKRRLLRDLWLLAGLPMLLWPTVQVVVPVLLGMTCLSFSILDETG